MSGSRAYIHVALMVFGLMVAILGGASDGHAQSLKEARAQDAADRALEREAVYTRSICGGDLAVQIDWRSAGGWNPDQLFSECDKALSAIEAACRRGSQRATSLRRFVCAGDGGGASYGGRSLRYGAGARLNAFGETASALNDR